MSTQAAGFAVAADHAYDGDRGTSSDGLEISKLGINQEIVSALAKKGITKLFPIQVNKHSLHVFFFVSGLCFNVYILSFIKFRV